MTQSDLENVLSHTDKLVTKAKRIRRRMSQAFHLVAGRNFQTPETASQSLQNHYENKEEVGFHSRLVRKGLVDFELEALEWAQNNCDLNEALVIGCGAGREVFPLEKAGIRVTGIDSSPEMIKQAKKMARRRKSKAQFVVGTSEDLDTNDKFDLIFITPGLTGHFPTVGTRIEFLNSLKDLLKPGGLVFIEPDIVPFGPFSKQSLASALLKIKWRRFPGAWSKGDTLRGFWGHEDSHDGLHYFHYYQSEAEVKSELQLAGLRPIQRIGDVFIASGH
ncbi:MAG: methyltransferase domain-containing protein [Bdellovibrionaceae bacterium]|nr:methyltransferase domain-containing protein [Bdellovibrionales bacterium]MCB9084625.1 methyltransferase domain-containing protein [Pseudobdellovibrionaceae bacterium]